MELSNIICHVSMIRTTGHFQVDGVWHFLFKDTVTSPTAHESWTSTGWDAGEKPRAHASRYNLDSEYTRDYIPSNSKTLSPVLEEDEEEISEDCTKTPTAPWPHGLQTAIPSYTKNPANAATFADWTPASSTIQVCDELLSYILTRLSQAIAPTLRENASCTYTSHKPSELEDTIEYHVPSGMVNLMLT